MNRRDELATNLTAVSARIHDACTAAGRDPDEVTLIVVTKFFPASDVRLLAELGVRDLGENRYPEGRDKAAVCADLDLTWHFIGHVQSNKAAAIAGYADAIHSVDRAKLVSGLGRGAHQRGRPVDCLVQVSLGGPGVAGRSGAVPSDVPGLAERIAGTEGLRLRGVMAVAPLDADPASAFSLLADVAASVRRVDPSATWISGGMSQDLEAAVKSGATHVRIGRAVLGERPTNR